MSRQDWLTPGHVLDVVRRVGPIGLDPCGHQDSLVGARCEYRLSRCEDGLTMPWVVSAGEVIFVNPPYRNVGPWVGRAVDAGWKMSSCILLIPAAVGTKVWQSMILPRANAVCFWRGRITFVGATLGAKSDSAFVFFGPPSMRGRFAEEFYPYGHVIERPV